LVEQYISIPTEELTLNGLYRQTIQCWSEMWCSGSVDQQGGLTIWSLGIQNLKVQKNVFGSLKYGLIASTKMRLGSESFEPKRQYGIGKPVL
jgi:hypothetical protein